jgi:hypothetical protein
MASGRDRLPASGRARWLPALLAAAGIALAPPTALLSVVLLLPSAMAWIADGSPGRPAVRAVLLFGLAASCGPLDMLWRSAHQLEASVMLVGDLRVVAIAWSAQAGGWLLTQMLPLMIGGWIEAETRLHIGRLNARKQSLAEEWDQNEKT